MWHVLCVVCVYACWTHEGEYHTRAQAQTNTYLLLGSLHEKVYEARASAGVVQHGGLCRHKCKCTARSPFSSTICGDGKTVGTETSTANFCHDDNQADGDGCSASCRFECEFNCSGGTKTSRHVCETTCGDSKLAGNETCDDGSTNAGL